jgi:hypothetical protein
MQQIMQHFHKRSCNSLTMQLLCCISIEMQHDLLHLKHNLTFDTISNHILSVNLTDEARQWFRSNDEDRHCL